MAWEPKGAQVEAMKRSRGKPGFGFFMEQGLGKTSTTYGDFLDHAQAFELTRMVTIAPNSFKGGWADEVDKFGFPITPLIWDGSNVSYLRSAIKRGFNTRPNLIVNYEAIRHQHVLDFIQEFVGERRAYIAADESIQLKQFDSLQTKAALSIAPKFDFRRILSGKPIAQGPHDLWAQGRFIGLWNGHVFHAFKNAFCKMGGFKNKQVIGAMNEDILAERLDPHVFRATKAEWTDLPPKLPLLREYTMTPDQKKLYQSMENDFVIWLSENEHVAVDIAITKYIKLAQIQSGFIIDAENKTHILVDPKKNPRLNALEEYIDQVNGKTIVVYNHKVMRPMLLERFEHLNPTYIAGGMTTEEIEHNKAMFNNDNSCRVIFITKAAKYGHTLLGNPEPENHCSDMAFLENTYSLDDRSQLEDRNHRYGQIGETNWYADFVGTALDRNAVRALQRKESVFQAVFANIGKNR